MARQKEAPAVGASNRRTQAPLDRIACHRGRRRVRFHPSRALVHRSAPVEPGASGGQEDRRCRVIGSPSPRRAVAHDLGTLELSQDRPHRSRTCSRGVRRPTRSASHARLSPIRRPPGGAARRTQPGPRRERLPLPPRRHCADHHWQRVARSVPPCGPSQGCRRWGCPRHQKHRQRGAVGPWARGDVRPHSTRYRPRPRRRSRPRRRRPAAAQPLRRCPIPTSLTITGTSSFAQTDSMPRRIPTQFVLPPT